MFTFLLDGSTLLRPVDRAFDRVKPSWFGLNSIKAKVRTSTLREWAFKTVFVLNGFTLLFEPWERMAIGQIRRATRFGFVTESKHGPRQVTPCLSSELIRPKFIDSSTSRVYSCMHASCCFFSSVSALTLISQPISHQTTTISCRNLNQDQTNLSLLMLWFPTQESTVWAVWANVRFGNNFRS